VGWAQDETTSLSHLAWLNGSWYSENGQVEEHWTTAKGSVMLGLNRDCSRPGRAFFEYLRIEERQDGIYYVASPRGGPATSFKLTTLEKHRAVFENPAHDFPQKIVYHLDAQDRLCATVSAKKGTQLHWCWQRGRLAEQDTAR
jgi:hypothetical protein